MSAPHGHPHGELRNPDTAHETTDINLRAIAMYALLLAAITIGIQIAMYGEFLVFDRIERAADQTVSPLATPAGQVPPDPRLQTTPWADLTALRAQEFSFLHSYGWVDQDAGVVRLPIDRAKALLLERGLPVRSEPVDAAEGTTIAATGESTGGRNLPVGGPDRSAAPAPTPDAARSAPAPATGPQNAPAAPPKKPGGGQ
jgi:hypothetical protein